MEKSPKKERTLGKLTPVETHVPKMIRVLKPQSKAGSFAQDIRPTPKVWQAVAEEKVATELPRDNFIGKFAVQRPKLEEALKQADSSLVYLVLAGFVQNYREEAQEQGRTGRGDGGVFAATKSRSRVLIQGWKAELDKVLESLSATGNLVKGASLLELSRVVGTTPKAYVENLGRKIGQREINPGADAEVNQSLVKYFHEEFRLSAKPEIIFKTIAALMSLNPLFSKTGKCRIPWALRGVSAWQLEPSHSKWPWDWAIWSSIVVEMEKLGMARLGALVVVAKSVYMTLNGPHSLTSASLLAPTTSGISEYVVLLFLERELGRSKTGESDARMPLDGRLPGMPWHSKASIHRSKSYWPLREVQHQGRWRSTSDLRRYGKEIELNEGWKMRCQIQQTCCEKCRHRIQDIVLRGVLPDRPINIAGSRLVSGL